MRVEEPAPTGRPWSSPLWVRLVPLALVVLVACVRTLHPVDDPDTWWHLRAGDELRRDLVLVGSDPWSPFTSHEWIRHQWLGEVLMSWVHGLGGLPAVAWLVTAFAALTFVTSYVVARRGASVLVATSVALLAFVGTSMTLSARPQSLSLAFAVVAAAGWLATDRDHRAHWWLVPLTWLWACCHGFWFLAPALGVVTAVGLALERAPRAVVARAWAVTLACVGAAALTPVGPRVLAAPFEVSRITALIEEWQPPTVGMPAFLAVWAMAVLLLLLWSVGDPPTWTEVGVLVLATYLLVSHGRTVALAAAMLVPVLARALQGRIPLVREAVGRLEVGVLVAAVLVGLGASWGLAGARAAEPQGFPTGLDRELSATAPGTVVCNDYDAGGWLWWAHPDLVPVIDGRTELYDAADVESYARFANGTGTDVQVRRFGCTAALVHPESASAAVLRAEGWSAAATAEGWTLLTAPESSAGALVD